MSLDKNSKHSFPNPLADASTKESMSYGLQYAKAIENQWGKIKESTSLYGKRNAVFERSRDYANGTQDTNIYKKLLRSLNPNDGDGSLMNMDYTPVPILPKFVRVVVNKILSKDPYPNLEAIDPLSSSEKNNKRGEWRSRLKQKNNCNNLSSRQVW